MKAAGGAGGVIWLANGIVHLQKHNNGARAVNDSAFSGSSAVVVGPQQRVACSCCCFCCCYSC